MRVESHCFNIQHYFLMLSTSLRRDKQRKESPKKVSSKTLVVPQASREGYLFRSGCIRGCFIILFIMIHNILTNRIFVYAEAERKRSVIEMCKCETNLAKTMEIIQEVKKWKRFHMWVIFLKL